MRIVMTRGRRLTRGLAGIAALAAIATAPLSARADTTPPTLVFATALPPGNPLSAQVLHPWADRVNAAVGDKLKIDIRDGMAIANLNNSYDRVVGDVVQISWLTHSNFAGKFLLSTVGGLPFEADTSEKASVAMWRLYQKGAFAAEYDQVRPIMLAVLSQAGFHFRKAPASLDNLKGLKVLPASKETGNLASALGMAPIVLAVTDSYEALQRGTVDGAMLGWTAVQSFKLEEVTSYHVDAALGSSTGMMFISKKAYDALPPESRAALDQFSGEGESRTLGKFWDRLTATGQERVKAMNQTVLDAPTEIVAKWRIAAAPTVDAWTKAAPQGDQVLQQFRAELAKVDAQP
jgi:TRAP-type C4-dicarboxylate transport system substrate-binding protein